MDYSIPQNKELMRVFKDLEIVEQMGSVIHHILERYLQSIYHSTPNFIRVVLPFAQVTPQVEPLLVFCAQPTSRNEMLAFLELKDINHFKKSILNPLLETGLLQRTVPDKPSSPQQRFMTTVQVEGEV